MWFGYHNLAVLPRLVWSEFKSWCLQIRVFLTWLLLGKSPNFCVLKVAAVVDASLYVWEAPYARVIGVTECSEGWNIARGASNRRWEGIGVYRWPWGDSSPSSTALNDGCLIQVIDMMMNHSVLRSAVRTDNLIHDPKQRSCPHCPISVSLSLWFECRQ